MEYVKHEAVFNLDGNTQLEFLNTKTIMVIDKERFSICKQLMIEDAPDEDFASFLNIPPEKVRYFKYKMQIFEDSIRARRRAAKLEKRRKRASKVPIRKREISSEERFRRARDLISRNLSTNQISKILKVSERSVTRFKRRMREEKQRLKAEGKIVVDPNDPDDENSFRHLKPEEKLKKAKELFRRRLKIQEISEILKISERSVRRWKDKLSKIKNEESEAAELNESIESTIKDEDDEEDEQPLKPLKRSLRSIKPKLEPVDDEDEADEDVNEPTAQPARKKRRLYVDREKVQYAKELIDNKLSNKEMSMLLEMSIACVRKLKAKIQNGTVEELIDNSEEHYTKVGRKVKSEAAEGEKIDPDTDPLHLMEIAYMPNPSTSSSFGYERKPKVVLRDREMKMVHLLRENNIRTMDIAKMMKISERSVTRLLAKSRELDVIEYDAEVLAEVEKLMAQKDEILNADSICGGSGDAAPDADSPGRPPGIEKDDSAKRQLGLSLLAMNVKNKDIAKMLDVSDKTVQRWKAKVQQQEHSALDDSHSVFSNLIPTKEETDVEYEEYE